MTAGDQAIRVSAAAIVVGIGAIAAYVSYRHAYDVATAHGETGATARLLPLTIDGLVYVASMVMLDAARRRAAAPALARWALAMGIGATVAVNVLHGIAYGPIGAVIAAWPAVTLVVAVELLMTMIRHGRAEVATSSPAVEHATNRQPVVVNGAALQVVPNGHGGNGRAYPDELQIRGARVFADDVTAGRVPGLRAIKQQLRIGQDKAREVQEYLSVLANQ